MEAAGRGMSSSLIRTGERSAIRYVVAVLQHQRISGRRQAKMRAETRRQGVSVRSPLQMADPIFAHLAQPLQSSGRLETRSELPLGTCGRRANLIFMLRRWHSAGVQAACKWRTSERQVDYTFGSVLPCVCALCRSNPVRIRRIDGA